MIPIILIYKYPASTKCPKLNMQDFLNDTMPGCMIKLGIDYHDNEIVIKIWCDETNPLTTL